MKTKLVGLLNIIRAIIAIFGYVTGAMFLANGFSLLNQKEYLLAGLVFLVCLVYFSVLAASFIIAVKKHKTKDQRFNLRVVNFIKKFCKLIILVSTIVLTTKLFELSELMKRLNIAWLIALLFLDIVHFAITYTIKRLGELVSFFSEPKKG